MKKPVTTFMIYLALDFVHAHTVKQQRDAYARQVEQGRAKMGYMDNDHRGYFSKRQARKYFRKIAKRY